MKISFKKIISNTIFCIIFIFTLNSCYFTTNWYDNSFYYQNPDFKLNLSDTLIITSLIHPDSNLREYANLQIFNAINKFGKFKAIDVSTTTQKLKNEKVYSLPFDLNDELMTQLFDIFKSKYILIWYFSKLEETNIGKDGNIELVLNIYDLSLQNKVWSCKSNLSMISPAPPEGSTYFYSLGTNETGITKLIDKIINKEFPKIVSD